MSLVPYLIALGLGILLASGVVTTTGLSITPYSASTGIFIPLYTYPGSTWNEVVQQKQAHDNVPFLVVINPNSGVGAVLDPNYVSGIRNLQSAGVIVLGYVYTDYAQRSASSVEGEMSLYKSWYGVDGIFLDEAPSQSGSEAYYSSLSQYANGIGLTDTVENQGVTPSASYVGTASLLNVYEGAGLPNLSSLPNYGKGNMAVLAYGVSSLDANWLDQAKGYLGYVYVTDDSLPNPWDSLPSYFAQEVADLATAPPTTTTVTQQGTTTTVTTASASVSSHSTSVFQYFGYGIIGVSGLALVVNRPKVKI